jgi:hypothetical protein
VGVIAIIALYAHAHPRQETAAAARPDRRRVVVKIERQAPVSSSGLRGRALSRHDFLTIKHRFSVSRPPREPPPQPLGPLSGSPRVPLLSPSLDAAAVPATPLRLPLPPRTARRLSISRPPLHATTSTNCWPLRPGASVHASSPRNRRNGRSPRFLPPNLSPGATAAPAAPHRPPPPPRTAC